MTELADRLQSSLGSQYRVERELGGGGMSRVFLAEETALGRKVVIKLLPPELAVELSADRFQREVRVAAALQHPHIVPLLAAGAAGDILYYTMPYVDGESLRARLAREGELPVSEAVRLLREVTDALAYAHRQGIVHRDIKPDNILLSQGHAVITDFGIAKALTAAGRTSAITGTGVSIGTPTYMAPEQATGEPVDQRADLYSLGALGYEMLTGEPPFRGSTAQALIAAQISRSAPPLAEARPAVAPELAAAIHRCLEKRPADRFQRAEELLAALDATVTPTGMRTIPQSQPQSPSGPPPTREWPLPQVLGLFALAGAAVLGVAWALRTLAGLPDWFFPAAVILLALGLPVVVLATLSHNRRLRTGATTPVGTAGSGRRRLTLRRAVLGGVGAFSALGIVTAGYMAMRTLGIGPVGTLVASGKLKERERLILADFDDQTRGALLGPAVTQAFRVDFSQSKLVSPVEADYVRRVLRRMQRPDSVPVSLTVAREIAQREGFKAVVAGELQQVGPSLLVSAQLVNAQSGEVLATARETARDSTGILDAVDRVSKQLRERIGESLRSIRANPALADVTTGSLEALRKYSQALQVQSQGDDPAAVGLLEDAVAQDSNFAMAWRKLGTMLANAGLRPARSEAAINRAYALRDRLTVRERKLTEYSYYSEIRGAIDSAAAALQSLLAEYPNDSWAWNNLGVASEVVGNKAEAEQAYLKASQLEPENILAWGNLYTLRIGLARFDSAAATLKYMQARFPAGPGMDFRSSLLPLGRRDYAVAESVLTAAVSRYRGNPIWHDGFLSNLAGVQAIRGKLAESERNLKALGESVSARGDSAGALESEALRVIPSALFRENSSGARAALDEALRRHPIERLGATERPLVVLIRAALAAGDRERAVRLLDEFDRNRGNVPGRAWPYLRQQLRGEVLALRKETIPEALLALRKAASTCAYCADPPMAMAFERAGMTDSALVHYQRWADAGENFWEAGVYFHWAPLAYFRLGELYEAQGERAKAVDYYGRFTELWREADPDLQPRVKEAIQRIVELRREPTGQRIGEPPKKP
ncbi:MAG TPA: protein kinase [Gemmatimonadales bacterium]|nr:protein kinase [Gemmatimonadales bacterium]